MYMKTFWVLASFIAGSSVIATNNYTGNSPDKNRSKNSAPVGTVYVLIDKSDYELSYMMRRVGTPPIRSIW
jgi:hypothetical protein